jgi:uncharacterized cupin superfamily protein
MIRREFLGAALLSAAQAEAEPQTRPSSTTALSMHVADAKLRPDRIEAKDIISGAPQAGDLVFSTSADHREQRGIWSCTRGSFHWTFDCDETAVVIQGRVVVQMEDGTKLTLGPGDVAFFPNGLKCVWNVEEDLRKVYVLYRSGQ